MSRDRWKQRGTKDRLYAWLVNDLLREKDVSVFPGVAAVKRELRSLGGKLIRRVGLLPGGVPNRLGDDVAWANRAFAGDVVLFFPDTSGGLYQLRSWYGPLKELHKTQGVTIVCMDSKSAKAIRRDLPEIPVMTISQEAFLDKLVARSDTRLFLYVNYTQANFLALRIRSVIHVSLLHGDSDKSVSVSNQVKAFDYSFVAGQAAIDRFKKYTALFDADERCIPIGRPQLDTDGVPGNPVRKTGEKRAVLYAPTWEGGHDSVSYGSLPSHGLNIVKSLIESGFRVTYRPHPLTGQRLSSHGEADGAIRRYLSGSPGHKVSTNGPISEDFAEADLLVGDVSSVVNDWLITGKPMIITKSDVKETKEAATQLLDLAPRLSAASAMSTGALAREQIDTDPTREQRVALAEYYFGDTRPGESLKRFLAACREVSETRDSEWQRISANEASG